MKMPCSNTEYLRQYMLEQDKPSMTKEELVAQYMSNIRTDWRLFWKLEFSDEVKGIMYTAFKEWGYPGFTKDREAELMTELVEQLDIQIEAEAEKWADDQST